MNLETQLQIQAWLDGELSDSEALAVQTLAERDPAAKALVAEIRAMRTAFSENETPARLTESREFYWSKIRREIERIEAGPLAGRESSAGWVQTWRRWLMPVAGTAVVALVAVALAWVVTPATQSGELGLTEIENLSDDVGSYSFRAPGQNMLVVWVYDKAETPNADVEFPTETTVQ